MKSKIYIQEITYGPNEPNHEPYEVTPQEAGCILDGCRCCGWNGNDPHAPRMLFQKPQGWEAWGDKDVSGFDLIFSGRNYLTKPEAERIREERRARLTVAFQSVVIVGLALFLLFY